MKTRTLLATVALVLFAVHSKADAIPHQSVVSAALAKTFAVSATGNVTGPFPEGRAASGSDMEDVYDSSELRPSWIGGLPQSSPLLHRPRSECDKVVLPVERFAANGE